MNANLILACGECIYPTTNIPKLHQMCSTNIWRDYNDPQPELYEPNLWVAPDSTSERSDLGATCVVPIPDLKDRLIDLGLVSFNTWYIQRLVGVMKESSTYQLIYQCKTIVNLAYHWNNFAI